MTTESDTQDLKDLDQLERIIRSRRAVRHFLDTPIPDGILERLLDAARWAPSGYNLQPTHFMVVTDQALKKDLHPACFWQPQILEAPAVVVFTGDKDVVPNNLDRVIKADTEIGAMNEQYEGKMRHFVNLAFEQGPIGIRWFGKATVAPIMRAFKPVPSIPAVHKRYWLAKQVSLSCMNFMLAATAAGLATCPMEGFDETRVRSVLKVPANHIIPLVVPVGYAAEGTNDKSRLPLDEMTHYNKW